MKFLSRVLPFILPILLMSCGSAESKKTATDHTTKNDLDGAPTFNADSAFSYIVAQEAFGPRVPGSPGHKACAEYLTSFMAENTDTVITQRGTVTAYNGDRLPIVNIMGRVKPQLKDRVLVLAHWDTRPWADADPDEANHNRPINGANDGGSGVAVIMEIARQLKTLDLPVGVDLLLVDAEDYGHSATFENTTESWCLGTQYFVDHLPYGRDALPRYGICLDMVGGRGAVFHREYMSEALAGSVVDRVWNVAARSGFGDRFINSVGGSIVDDHIFINRAGIPCIDIVEINNPETGSFPPTWHTLDDTSANIDRSSLRAAGQTVLNTLYLDIPR